MPTTSPAHRATRAGDQRGQGTLEYVGIVVVAAILVAAVVLTDSGAQVRTAIGCQIRSIVTQAGACGGGDSPTTYDASGGTGTWGPGVSGTPPTSDGPPGTVDPGEDGGDGGGTGNADRVVQRGPGGHRPGRRRGRRGRGRHVRGQARRRLERRPQRRALRHLGHARRPVRSRARRGHRLDERRRAAALGRRARRRDARLGVEPRAPPRALEHDRGQGLRGHDAQARRVHRRGAAGVR